MPSFSSPVVSSDGVFTREMLEELGISRPWQLSKLEISLEVDKVAKITAELFVTEEQLENIDKMRIEERANKAKSEEEKAYILEIAQLLNASCGR